MLAIGSHTRYRITDILAALVRIPFLPDLRQACHGAVGGRALSDLLEVVYHHVVLSARCQLRGVMAFNHAT